MRVKRWLRRASTILIVASLAGCASSKETNRDPNVKSPLPVAVLQIKEQSNFASTRAFTGTVRAGRQSPLAFERPGIVMRIKVDEGSRIRKGSSLASLDRSQLLAQKRRLEAQIKETDAATSIAAVTSKRLGALAAKDFAPKQASDEADASLAAAQARGAGISAALEAVRIDLRKSELVAPFSGTVTQRSVDEGTVVQAGQSVITIREEGALEAVVGVPEGFARSVTKDQAFELQAGTSRFKAKVQAKVADVDPKTRTVDIIFALPDHHNLAPGTVVRMEQPRARKESGFWVPVAALKKGLRGLWSVYGLKSDRGRQEKPKAAKEPEGTYRIVREEVEVLYTGGERAFVRGTLEDGDLIVRSAVHRVVPGQRVRPAEGSR